jgi:hypothetical protein
MHKTIDTRKIETAADLLRFIQEVEAVGYPLDTLYLFNVDHITLFQERLTDRSLAFNLAFVTTR